MSMLPPLAVSNNCNVDAGDRLISVNDVNLDELSHATTIDILQNAPDDVILVVSQPKEKLYKGKSWIMSAICHFPVISTMSGKH